MRLEGIQVADSAVKAGGTYVSIWKKGDDGDWRVVVDAGTPPE